MQATISVSLVGETPWYVNLVNYLATSVLPKHSSTNQTKKLKSNVKYYIWDDPFSSRSFSD